MNKFQFLRRLATTLTFILIAGNLFALEKLRYIGDANFPTGLNYKETNVGGLSGLTYDPASKKLLIISDDRSSKNPARYYEFDLEISEKKFQVNPSKVITLKRIDQTVFPEDSIDFEGIALMDDKLIISSEGSLKKKNTSLPAIFRFSKEGQLLDQLEIPQKYFPEKDKSPKDSNIGVRGNLVFEALSASTAHKLILVGTEESLIQDDRVSTPTYASKTRLIQYDNQLNLTKEMLYQLDKVPGDTLAGIAMGETGLVDLAIIDHDSAYSLERAFLPLVKKTYIKIFKISNFSSATNISKMESIKGKEKEIVPVKKELILSLDTIVKNFSANYQTTDNIEGMCIGPKLPNGNDTLILVSDNNFIPLQRTQFLAFEIIKD